MPRSLPLALVLAAAMACSPVPRSPPLSGAPSASPSAPSEPSLRALADSLAQREACTDSCCLGDIPPWFLGPDLHHPDSQHAPALRSLLDTTRDPRVRALALRWLAQALDVDDVPRMAQFVASTEPAGRFPIVTYGQRMERCYPVAWTPVTLGEVSLGALSAITGESFPTAEAFHRWHQEHPDPRRSIQYWERVLGRASPPPPERMEDLRNAGAELYAKVLLSAPDGQGYGTGEPEIVRAAREIIGPERVLRVLAREETWPELQADDQRLVRLAVSVLRRAEAIFSPGHGPELLRLWQQRALDGHHVARAALAVATSRLHPPERCNVLDAALSELSHGHAVVLEELARRCAADRPARLTAWFYGPATPKGDAHDNAAAILRGLAGAQDHARPALQALVRRDLPLAEDADVTEALMDAAIAAGCPGAFPRRPAIRPPARKNLYAGPDGERRRAAAEAEAAAARSDCVRRALSCMPAP